MSISVYGNVDNAIDLADLKDQGVTAKDISTATQEEIANFINTNIRPEGFAQLSSVEDYTIRDSNVNFLILKNCPIVNVETIVDNLNNPSVSKTITSDCYYVDSETGIIQLLSDKDLSDTTAIKYFTKGINSVRITYDYGFAAVPNDINIFATLLLAKWAVINQGQKDADGNLKSLKIGDYTEVYDLKFMNVATKFDANIVSSYSRLKVKYNKGI